jgi:ubiquinone/menaquinone biosynthesis C-methylase UbiE
MNEYYSATRKRFQGEEVAEGYEKRRYGTLKGKFLKYREEMIVRGILDDIGSGLRIIDVPCGTGRFSWVLREYSDYLVGADLSDAMLTHSKNKGQYSELHRCEIESMPFQDGYCDVLVSFRFFHHLAAEERAKAFAEIYRVTKKYFIFSFNSKDSVAYVVNNLILKKPFYSETIETIRGELARYFTVKGIFRVLPFIAGETIVFCEKKPSG